MSPEDKEKLEIIRDKFRGYPLRNLEIFAHDIGVDLPELLEHTRDYLEHGDYWNEGDRFEYVDMPRDFWNWYELVTGEIVPADKRGHFFSCSC